MLSRNQSVLSLVAFGLLAGAAALGDDPVVPTVFVATDPIVDAFVVDDPASHVPGDPWTMCVTVDDTGAVVPSDLPCVVFPGMVSSDPSVVAATTLVPGANYLLVPDVGSDVLAVSSMPDNPGVN